MWTWTTQTFQVISVQLENKDAVRLDGHFESRPQLHQRILFSLHLRSLRACFCSALTLHELTGPVNSGLSRGPSPRAFGEKQIQLLFPRDLRKQFFFKKPLEILELKRDSNGYVGRKLLTLHILQFLPVTFVLQLHCPVTRLHS